MKLSLIAQHIQPQTLLDIGANRGDFSREATMQWPDIQCTLVEANPECEELLRRSGFPFHMAVVSDKVKAATFWTRNTEVAGGGCSLYREKTTFYNDQQAVANEVQTTTLDILFGEDRTFDLIKIDCQGSEVDILEGGKKLVSRASGLLLEVSVMEYNIGAPLWDDVLDYCKSIGFPEWLTLSTHYHPELQKTIVQHDVFFYKG
jgi:FkbM family methyltransferase